MLVGAGHAHVMALRQFGSRPLPGIRLHLVTREDRTPYSGMLPGLISSHYGVDDIHIDTRALARFAGAALTIDAVVDLDLERRQVIRRDGPPVSYDLLSMDIGSTPNTGAVPGAAEHAIPVKPIAGFLEQFEAMTARILARQGRARVAVVGAGAGGVELLLAVERRLTGEVAAAGFDPGGLAFALVSGSTVILPGFPARMQQRFACVLAARSIAVTKVRVARVAAGMLHLVEGPPMPADEILWATQAAAAPWLGKTGLDLDEQGFVRVDACLEAAGQDNVFASGDMAAFGPQGLRKSGVYAVRAGPVLADNIRRRLGGRRLRRYRPQSDALYIVTTGERRAVATRDGLVVEGEWVWHWKDWIDRRFMRQFQGLPVAQRSEVSSDL